MDGSRAKFHHIFREDARPVFVKKTICAEKVLLLSGILSPGRWM
jgi:hypothetical protein